MNVWLCGTTRKSVIPGSRVLSTNTVPSLAPLGSKAPSGLILNRPGNPADSPG